MTVADQDRRYRCLKEGSDFMIKRADHAVATGQWESYWLIYHNEFPDVAVHAIPNLKDDQPWRES